MGRLYIERIKQAIKVELGREKEDGTVESRYFDTGERIQIEMNFGRVFAGTLLRHEISDDERYSDSIYLRLDSGREERISADDIYEITRF